VPTIELGIIFTAEMMKKFYTNNISLASQFCWQQEQEYCLQTAHWKWSKYVVIRA